MTVISSAILMLERGYNTLKKAWGQAKAKKAAKSPPKPAEPETQPEPEPEAADPSLPTDAAEDQQKWSCIHSIEWMQLQLYAN